MQRRLLGLCRSAQCYGPPEPNTDELALMRCTEELVMAHQSNRSRRTSRHLRRERRVRVHAHDQHDSQPT